MTFDGKVVWITGASSGIGAELAREFARAGAKLILSARRIELLERVAASCGGPARARALRLDMADHDSIPSRAIEARELFGPIDILVNNAGITQRSLAAETQLKVDKRIMDVNYFGTLAVTRAVLPEMIARREGHVVTVTSVLGKFGAMHRSGYAASKHALHGFFDALRAELHPHNVRVTLIAPGWIRTDIAKTALEADGSPHGRIDRPDGGMDPAVFARRAIRAIRKKKREAVIGGLVEVLGIHAHRFFPGLFARVVRAVRLDPKEKNPDGA